MLFTMKNWDLHVKNLIGEQSETLARPKKDFPATEYEGKFMRASYKPFVTVGLSLSHCQMSPSHHLTFQNRHSLSAPRIIPYQPLFADARRTSSRCQSSGFLIVQKVWDWIRPN